MILTVVLVTSSMVNAQTKHLNKKTLKEVQTAVNVLAKWYTPEYTVSTTNWWNAANAVTTIIRYSKITGDKAYLPLIDSVFERNRNYYEKDSSGVSKLIAVNFLNDYYDDEGWWALAWIDAYNLTNNKKYRDMAEIIFADMADSYDTTCNGGIYWKRPKHYKNAIANGLFALTAFRLHKADANKRANGKSYLEWGEDIGRWFYRSGMLNAQWLIEDGLKNDCTPNRGNNWTYNQGVPIAVLCEAYELTRDDQWLQLADKIAGAVMNSMVYPSGVLKEKNEPNLNNDATQFKGIFMRHLGYLYSLNKKPEYKLFILKNADSIWNNARNPKTNQLGAIWNGPVGIPNASTHSSALDCLVEALNIK